MTTSTTGAADLRAVLEEFGLGSMTADVVSAVRSELAGASLTSSAAPSRHTEDYLREHSGLADISVIDRWSAQGEDEMRASRAAARVAHQLSATVSREGAAQELGLSPSRISHLAADGHLFVLKFDGRPRFPRWQFHRGELVPGLSAVIPALVSSGLDAVDVATIMTSPTESLDGRSPVEYLAGGGSVVEVVAVIASVARQ